MSILREILRNFRLNVFVLGGAWWTAYVVALAVGVPAVPLFAVAMVLGTVLAVLLAFVPREAVLRRVARRPRRIMTPDDYRHLRELEAELGWEPSEPPAPANPDCNAELPAGWTPQAQAPAQAAPAVCECTDETRGIVQVRVPESATALASYCAACGRGTGTLTSAGSVPLSGTAALSGTGTLSAKATWDDVAYASEASQHFAQLARVGRERCIGSCPICAERSRP